LIAELLFYSENCALCHFGDSEFKHGFGWNPDLLWDRISPAPPFPPNASGTEEILWQPIMMPSGDLYPSIDYWMPHQQLKMLVRFGTDSAMTPMLGAAREAQ
jgi:hypothetical protein